MSFLTPKEIPKEYKKAYQRECEKKCCSLFLAVSLGMFVIEALILIFQLIRLGDRLFDFFYFTVYIVALIFSAAFGITYFLYKTHKLTKNQRFVDCAFVICLIILGMLTSYAEFTASGNYAQNTIFIMLMFAISSILYFHYKAIIAFLIFATAAFVGVLQITQFDSNIKVAITLDKLFLLILMICVTVAFYNNRVALFMQNTELEKVNESLQKSNMKLEKLNTQLEQTAITDALTGVLNRMAFNNILKTQWNFCYREEEPLAVLMIDVDYFKQYNDTYGHIQGDKCLQHVAQSIVKSLRKTGDFIFRYGGEEFTCLLPSTNIDGAIIAAERIVQELKEEAIVTNNNMGYVTVSIGIHACIPEKGLDMYKFVEKADIALYKSKNSGRNMYTVYSENDV